ncbi:hypothetical protein LEP1GSC188_4846 [Leptospira weilii serovar Topaz str. LT2116]|uniref:Uncharacterized protein n=1 Tax=Leptospira weilii serovar Topaz str. LT2116 TaxID=1088540 RepID=M3GU49_9LEPT|nr:hypothetical protein LEP1GSC188_4846 [Leptospira weilii serovar Topaz str. LT2116]
MDFYLFISFMMGALSTAFAFFLERAYSDLIRLKPRAKTRTEAEERAINAICKLQGIRVRLGAFSETLKFQKTMLDNVFEFDENPDYVHIRTELENLITLVDSKVLKYK